MKSIKFTLESYKIHLKFNIKENKDDEEYELRSNSKQFKWIH